MGVVEGGRGGGLAMVLGGNGRGGWWVRRLPLPLPVVVGGWLQEGRNSWHVKSSIEDFKLCFGVVCLVAFTTVLISDDITSYNSLNSRFIKKQ